MFLINEGEDFICSHSLKGRNRKLVNLLRYCRFQCEFGFYIIYKLHIRIILLQLISILMHLFRFVFGKFWRALNIGFDFSHYLWTSFNKFGICFFFGYQKCLWLGFG